MARPSRSSISTPVSRLRRSLRRRSASWAERHARTVVVAAACYLAVLLLGSVVFALSARANGSPAVVVLGSGSHLSILITSGPSRVLIAGGDDGSAFMSALAGARGPLERRIDVAILSGKASDLAVANRVVRDLSPRRVFMVDGPLAARRSELTSREIAMVSHPIAIELPGGVSIEVEPARPRGDSPSGDWRARISRGTSTILATSRLPDDELTPSAASVVIVTGEAEPAALSELEVPAIALQNGVADSAELAVAFAGATGGSPWLVRVQATARARFELGTSSVELPRSATRFAP